MNDYNAKAQYQAATLADPSYGTSTAGFVPPGVKGVLDVRGTLADECTATADKLELCADRIERFLVRFYNSETCENDGQPSSGGFIGSIERTTRCAAKISALCDRLDTIA